MFVAFNCMCKTVLAVYCVQNFYEYVESDMEMRELTFKLNKETKNTVRFSEVVADEETPVVGELYVQKSALGSDRPKELHVVIGVAVTN